MKNTITYEQAVNQNQLALYVDQYEQKVMEVVRYFMSNTAAQFFAMEMNLRALEMQGAMAKKDYSNYLFEQIESLHQEFLSNKDNMDKIKQSSIQLAKLNSKDLK